MIEAIPPLQILLERGQHIFAFDFGRYLIAASTTFALVALLRLTFLKTRKIQAREATFADMRREFLQSMQSVFVYVVGACFLIWGHRTGLFYNPLAGSLGIWTDLALLAGIIVAHDAYFYWAHRTMHHPRLFKTFHRAHHRSVTPTPWAAYSFAMPEAAVMFLFVPIWQFFVPTPGWVLFTWLNFQIVRNAVGHSGFEFFPRWWLSTPLTSWFNVNVHHDMHHRGGFNHHYGLYFRWWDQWMGTEHPDYRKNFDEVVDRGRRSEPALPSAVTA